MEQEARKGLEQRKPALQRPAAELMLLLAAVIWGGGFVAGKMALTTFTPSAVLSWRFGVSAILCFGIFFRRIRKTPLRTILSGAVIGCVQMAALSLQLTGLQYTTSAKQSFLCTAYVALTPFVSALLLRQKLHARDLLAGIICLSGIGLICLSQSLSLNHGDLLSLCFAVLFAVQVVLTGRFVSSDTDSICLTFFQLLTAAVIALVICLLRGEPLFCFRTESFIGIGYLAVLNTLAAFLLQNTAQKHVRDTTAAVIISLESVFGFLFSLLYYQEAPTIRLLLGGILCFGAVLLSVVPARDRSSAAGHSAGSR